MLDILETPLKKNGEILKSFSFEESYGEKKPHVTSKFVKLRRTTS